MTHPEMKRYFMTIPEACQLVLQAGAMGEGGEIFILDMGEPVKIVDLAREMISLSGFRPDEDIAIEFTGVRPGEKLFEELSTSAEFADKTKHAKIFIGHVRGPSTTEALPKLIEIARTASPEQLRAALHEIVPEYDVPGAAAPSAVEKSVEVQVAEPVERKREDRRTNPAGTASIPVTS